MQSRTVCEGGGGKENEKGGTRWREGIRQGSASEKRFRLVLTIMERNGRVVKKQTDRLIKVVGGGKGVLKRWRSEGGPGKFASTGMVCKGKDSQTHMGLFTLRKSMNPGKRKTKSGPGYPC